MNQIRFHISLLLFLFTFLLTGVATAQTPADSTATDSLRADTVKVEKKKKAPEKKETEYEKLMKKGGTTLQGFFTVRHIEDKYYFEVPDTMMGRLLLCVTRFTAVPQNFGQFSGEEITHCTVYLERRDTTHLLMRQYVLSQLATEGDQIQQTLQQSTVDPIVMAFKVIGRNKEDNASLVEATPLFRTDNNLTSFSSGDKTSLKVGALQSDRTFIDTMKVYPTNIEVATTRTYGSSAARSEASKTGSVTVGFNTSMVLLPRDPMRKRLWDERVGYFVNRFTRFSDTQHKTEHESFISRYRLVPKDKKKYLRGELTEPVKPIVYYIDPATPRKWVPYLIKGIEDWNVAFEAAGFKNAIQAREWPKDCPDMSLDDARFSVLRYLPSETENAYGPRIVDPRSGEIIEAHICWFHNVMSLLTKWYMVQCGPLDKRARTMHFDDRLMGQLIRFVSSHEVGHSLGLRHNMGASFATPVEKLRDRQWVEQHGHTASIMDYARFNYVAQPEDGISERGLFPRINDYDKWAIKWGYQWRPDFKDEYEEKERLMAETTATLKANPRLWYGGEGGGDDPRAQTEDLSDNSVKASEYGLKNLRRVLEQLPQWTHQDNDQYEDLTTMYRAVNSQYVRYMNHVMKNIGGRYHNNMPGREPLEVVPARRQHEAMQYITDNVFDAPEWLYPASIVNKIGLNATSDNSKRQETTLQRLLAASMLNNIYNMGTEDARSYQLDDYLDDLFSGVWRPLNDASEWKNKARRSLQRNYIVQLNRLLNPTDADLKSGNTQQDFQSDAVLFVEQHLSRVEQFCQEQAGAPTDARPSINALHYQDLLRQIKLIRERRTTVKP